MRGTILTLLSLGAAIVAPAQFYPDSNAVWCITHYTHYPYDVRMEMGADPDTLILGRTYKRIAEYSSESGQWERTGTWYVRNGPNGRGYVFSLGSREEYLAGDLGAQPGDTVRDVIGAGDVVVDSISTLTYGGVTVVRHYIDQHIFTPGRSFWQVGAGTSFGPFVIPQSLSGPQSECIIWNDSVRYNRYQMNGNVYGQPGGEACCTSVSLGLDERPSAHGTAMALYPNPASGHLSIRCAGMGVHEAAQVRLFDATGREVMEAGMRGPLLQLDVPRLSGLFMVVVDRGSERFTRRVIIH